MKKVNRAKYIIPIMVMALVLGGCVPNDNPNISSATATSEVELQSDALVNSEEITSSDIEENSSKEEIPSKIETSSESKVETISSYEESSSKAPKPVVENALIIQPNISIPAPMKFEDAVFGENINFEEQTIKGSGASSEFSAHIAIVQSLEELKVINKNDTHHYNDKYSGLYEEDIFEEKILIMLLVQRGHVSSYYSIDSITKEDGKMYIYMNNKNNGACVDRAVSYRTFITISREDMADVAEIIVYNDKEHELT